MKKTIRKKLIKLGKLSAKQLLRLKELENEGRELKKQITAYYKAQRKLAAKKR